MPEEFRVEYVADRAETTSTVWLGLRWAARAATITNTIPSSRRSSTGCSRSSTTFPKKGNVYNFGNEEPLIKAPTPEQQQRLQELDDNVAAAEQVHAISQLQKLSSEQKRAADALEGRRRRLPSLRTGVAGREGTGAIAMQLVGDGKRDFDGKRYLNQRRRRELQLPGSVHVRRLDQPESPKGAILSHSEDYFEGTGHGLYLIDGKIRLHVIFRWTDLGLRVETAQPVKLNEWQHVLVTYDGKRKAPASTFMSTASRSRLKVLFDELNWPIDVKVPFRIGAGGGLRFQGAIDDVRVYKIALTAGAGRGGSTAEIAA